MESIGFSLLFACFLTAHQITNLLVQNHNTLFLHINLISKRWVVAKCVLSCVPVAVSKDECESKDKRCMCV